MGHPDRRMRRVGQGMGRQLALGCALAGSAAFVCLPPTAPAQAVTQRVVEGKVVLSNGGYAKGAIVYLKNAKTLEVRTYISTADGSYRFGQLSPDADYTLWAEYQGKKSKEKTVSSFDTKQTLEMVLKVDAS